ncbi:hypothetical protein PGTUg99_011456 [Puccinia graminis f. sp. tritici]|uniref:Uncharacterized protein n=1 Tax=Puccinia graminis f. sp. tritici TaxID=56615 RepID=A0A5B0S3W8_PUCGR|nr:hypothetical protein PGTUg99_011456 [Puccinia graminis f. sp. tritici]
MTTIPTAQSVRNRSTMPTVVSPPIPRPAVTTARPAPTIRSRNTLAMTPMALLELSRTTTPVITTSPRRTILLPLALSEREPTTPTTATATRTTVRSSTNVSTRAFSPRRTMTPLARTANLMHSSSSAWMFRV